MTAERRFPLGSVWLGVIPAIVGSGSGKGVGKGGQQDKGNVSQTSRKSGLHIDFLRDMLPDRETNARLARFRVAS